MDIADQFDEAVRSNKVRLYRKKANVAIRPAVPGEVVETWIDGQRETVNTARAGDYVVCGARGEQYIISSETLATRYGPPGAEREGQSFRTYQAIGTCYAFQYEGASAKFVAPWGEEMIVNPGDYVGTPAIGSNRFYRIEKDVFAATYVEASA
jgi:hypothetical protein